MPDIQAMCKAMKLTWVKRLLDRESMLKTVAQAIIGIDFDDYFSRKIDESYIVNLPSFYKDVLEYWIDLHGVEPNSVNDVLNESLWHNKRILIDNKTVYYRNWSLKGIDILNDII